MSPPEVSPEPQERGKKPLLPKEGSRIKGRPNLNPKSREKELGEEMKDRVK